MSRSRLLAAIGTIGLAVATLPAAIPSASAAESPINPLQAQVALTEVAVAEAPTAGAVGPDGALWVGERAGAVRIVTDQGLSEPVLTVETTTDGERGLASMTFNPDYSKFYLSYTDLDGHLNVDAYDVVDGALQVDSRTTVLFVELPSPTHHSGHLVFGPDGMLYISLGDGEFSQEGDPHGNGQNLGSLLAKILRVDVSAGDPYAIPADNPFVDDPAARGEVWAYGLRNPWRFSFDAETGDMWIGDVGNLAREEINFVPAGPGGQNYGWPNMEGTLLNRDTEPANHTPPVYEWEHGTGGGRCDSVTAGFVYRGSAIPALQGSFVFSDWCFGALRALQVQDGQVTGVTDLGVNAGAVVSFVQTPDNELYVLDMGGSGGTGAIYRIDPAA